jgi:uncharacterized protein
MWINRSFSEVLAKAAAQSPAVLLIGARQTGKSSLIANQFPNHKLVSLDDHHIANNAAHDGKAFLETHLPPLFLDEIQYAPNLFRSLKVKIDENRNSSGQYILSGSQRFQLMEGVTESLAGRMIILELHGLSAIEIEAVTKAPLESDALLECILNGGYPEIHAKKLERNLFFSSYISSYLERDVRQIINVKNLRDFDRFLRLCAARSGQLLSANSLANELSMSATGVRHWLGVLEASHVIEIVEPWYSKVTQRIIKTPKLFFYDTGLLCALLNISSVPELKKSPFLGNIFETHVFSQLRKYYSNTGRNQPIHFFRNHSGCEIDFVVPRGGQFHLVEVKFSENSTLEKKNFNAFSESFGEESVLSRTLIRTRRGGYTKENGWYSVADSVDLSFLQ